MKEVELSTKCAAPLALSVMRSISMRRYSQLSQALFKSVRCLPKVAIRLITVFRQIGRPFTGEAIPVRCYNACRLALDIILGADVWCKQDKNCGSCVLSQNFQLATGLHWGASLRNTSIHHLSCPFAVLVICNIPILPVQ